MYNIYFNDIDGYWYIPGIGISFVSDNDAIEYYEANFSH